MTEKQSITDIIRLEIAKETIDEQEKLINILAEENDQLKQQLKTKVIVNRQYEELQRVKKENEQLKEEIKAKDKIIELYYEMVKE